MFDGSESIPAAIWPAMVKRSKRAIVEEIPGQAERLKKLRTAMGFSTGTAFAAFLGIGVQRYNNFENGQPISREIAFRMVQKISGLSLDWLYFGKTEALPLELARRLGELEPPGKRTTA